MREPAEKKIKELEEEKAAIEESIKKLTDEINSKRRSLNELKTKLALLNDKIKAKGLEEVSNTVSTQMGMNIDEFIEALKTGKVRIENNTDTTTEQPKPPYDKSVSQ